MWNLIKKYWDIFGGIITGLLLSWLASFKVERIQLIYSIIILMLVSIGLFRILKQAIDKSKGRKKTLIEKAVDSQKPIKAIRLAQNPTKDGEELGKLILDTGGELKKNMKNIKTFFDKFKGYLLTGALGTLTIVELCGGYIDQLFGNKLTINGIEILPLITLGAALIVGVLSNPYSKEQLTTINNLLAKPATKETDKNAAAKNEIVKKEISKTLKANEIKLKELNKDLATKENELANLKTELVSLNNTYEAKVEMSNMVPQLATNEEVLNALTALNQTKENIAVKEQEIEEVKTTIDNLTVVINGLKSRL